MLPRQIRCISFRYETYSCCMCAIGDGFGGFLPEDIQSKTKYYRCYRVLSNVVKDASSPGKRRYGTRFFIIIIIIITIDPVGSCCTILDDIYIYTYVMDASHDSVGGSASINLSIEKSSMHHKTEKMSMTHAKMMGFVIVDANRSVQ